MPNSTAPTTTVIKPASGWIGVDLKEIWRFRELFFIFTWRDFKVRYKQTVIGIAWAILQPFLLMVVFSIFFGNFAKIPSDGAPYPIFVYAGLLFWNYFSTALTSSSNSLVDNEGMLKKIYFPRAILTLSTTITPLVDFLFALVVFIGLLIYYHFTPTIIGVLLLPVLIIITFLTVAGLGSLLAAINVRYRDVRYALPFFIQSLLFVTPVIYPVSIIGEQYRWILALNPLTGVIQAARNGIIGTGSIDFGLLGVSALVAVGLFLLGTFYFRKTERIFADVA